MIAIVAIATTVLFFRNQLTVELTNVGTEPMHGLVIHVTGASYSVGELAPGARKTIPVSPSGESHIELEQSSGRRLVVDCYFESGYSGTISAEVSFARVVSVKCNVSA